jgi:predicted short-subunit dehydrogenase-like oxidoreductase (DUF2520 family)
VHSSGVYGTEVFESLAERGGMVGSLHPVFPFADVEASIQSLKRGATFAVETANEPLRNWLYDMVKAINGLILDVPFGKKAIYHSALVFASNYAVTLYALAERLLAGIGANEEAIAQALNVLITETTENLKREGIPNALTGPLVRGDAGTISEHLSALEKNDPHIAELYRQLAQQTIPILIERGVDVTQINQILDRSASHAHNRS